METLEDYRQETTEEENNRVGEWDTQQWLEEMLHRPSLQWYRIGKPYIGYDQSYRNTKRSVYLAKARTNSLQLVEHLGRDSSNYDKTCKLCHTEEDDLKKFIINCPTLLEKRDHTVTEPWKELDTRQQTAHILY